MTTHATLKADIATYLARDDLTALIPTFIRLCESSIRDLVKVRAMETTADLTLSSNTVAMPSGFIKARRLYFDTTSGRRELDYLPPDRFYASKAFSESGDPAAFTIEGDNFVFAPAPGGSPTAKLLYVKAFDALSGDADTNWLLTNAYDVYLYGCLAQAKAYIEDDQQAAKWVGVYEQAMDRVNRTAERSRRAGKLIRTGVPTP